VPVIHDAYAQASVKLTRYDINPKGAPNPASSTAKYAPKLLQHYCWKFLYLKLSHTWFVTLRPVYTVSVRKNKDKYTMIMHLYCQHF